MASTPDLQSILATLAQFAPPLQDNVSTSHNGAPSPASAGKLLPDEASEPAKTAHGMEKAEDPRLRPQSRSATASPRTMIDPGTITTWQDGLRCVTKLAAQNTQFAITIKRMMEEQRKHEMRWHSERQALKNTQANRANSTAQAQAILQSLGDLKGTPNVTSAGQVDAEAEMLAFDRKIYGAQKEMDEMMTMELKGLGIPYFGTNRTLLASDPEDIGPSLPSESRPKWSPIVTETQLSELRRRMVEHLEDLYRD